MTEETPHDKKQNTKLKRILICIGIILALPILWWCFFGGGATFKSIILYRYFDIEPVGDRTHSLQMTKEQIRDLKQKNIEENSHD